MAETEAVVEVSGSMKKTLLILSYILFAIGNCGGPLIMRLYFIHGGSRIWLSSFLQTAGCPVMIVPIILLYLRRHQEGSTDNRLFQMKLPLFLAAAIIGVMVGLDGYLYSYGVAKLPVSTALLIIASQLAFTAVFAFFLVKQKFTSYSVNAVVLLTVGSGVLALHTSGDRPEGESKREYAIGFVLSAGAAALVGLVLPLIELAYGKAKQAVTYTVVMEFQTVLCLSATLFCIVGMLVNNDFQVIPREGREFELGETKYYVILVFSALIWQCFFLGSMGVIFGTSSLFLGILGAVLLPINEILAVIFYDESFKAEKGVALILSLWGFVSYFYGEMKHSKKNKKQQQLDHNPELELPKTINSLTP